MALERNPANLRLSLQQTTTGSTIISFGKYAGGIIHIPAGYVSTTLSFYAKNPSGGLWTTLYKDDGTTQVTLTISAQKCFALPTAIFAAEELIITSNADDTSREVGLELKA